MVLGVVGFAATAIFSSPREVNTCSLKIELVDRRTGETLSGIVRVRDSAGQAVELPQGLNRGQGIEQTGPIHDWWAMPKAKLFTVPAAPLTVQAALRPGD